MRLCGQERRGTSASFNGFSSDLGLRDLLHRSPVIAMGTRQFFARVLAYQTDMPDAEALA